MTSEIFLFTAVAFISPILFFIGGVKAIHYNRINLMLSSGSIGLVAVLLFQGYPALGLQEAANSIKHGNSSSIAAILPLFISLLALVVSVRAR